MSRLRQFSLLVPCVLIACAVMLFAPAAVRGDLVLGAGGTVTLLPNTAGQEVMIFANGVNCAAIPNVGGMNLSVQIGDGGPDTGGTDLGVGVADPLVANIPGLTNIDMITGTIFSAGTQSGNAFGAIASYANGIANVALPGVGDVVPATGIVATLTFDTTGLPAAVTNLAFEFRIGSEQSPLATTDFAGTPICGNLVAGTLSVSAVPEPSSFAILGLISLLGLAVPGAKRAIRLWESIVFSMRRSA